MDTFWANSRCGWNAVNHGTPFVQITLLVEVDMKSVTVISSSAGFSTGLNAWVRDWLQPHSSVNPFFLLHKTAMLNLTCKVVVKTNTCRKASPACMRERQRERRKIGFIISQLIWDNFCWSIFTSQSTKHGPGFWIQNPWSYQSCHDVTVFLVSNSYSPDRFTPDK